MNACIRCQQFRPNINEVGICEKCAKEVRQKPLSFEVHFQGLVPKLLKTDKILSREEWINLKRQIDNYYLNTNDWEIEEINKRIARNESGNIPERNGYVYLIKSENELYKIGRTINVKTRFKDHERKFPLEIKLLHYIPSKSYVKAENYLHDKYKEYRMNDEEWFNLPGDEVQWLKNLTQAELDACIT